MIPAHLLLGEKKCDQHDAGWPPQRATKQTRRQGKEREHSQTA